MKILLVLALVTIASAKEFKVLDGQGKTCVLLDLEGTLDLSASQGSTQIGNKSLGFDGATVLNTSNCTSIKLDLTSSAQVWFQRGNKVNAYEIVPVSTFIPNEVWSAVNETDSPVFNGQALGSYDQDQSFTCKAQVERLFTLNGTPKQYNFTVTATTSNLQVQFGGIQNDTFSTGPVCDQDKSTTATPTTTPSTSPASTSPASTSPSPASTTPSPTPPTVDFNVTDADGNVTCIKIEGGFQMDIVYPSGKENLTYTAVVPKTASHTGNCSVSANTSTISIMFDAAQAKDWTLEFTFMKDAKNYYHVSEIDIKYPILPNGTKADQTSTMKMGADYLKATTKGYYTCKSKQSKEQDNVKLTLMNFKYKAFNTEKGIDFNGDVAECSADEETSSVVPIAVGAALAGLVVIVLIAYLIGRRRSRKSGYESV